MNDLQKQKLQYVTRLMDDCQNCLRLLESYVYFMKQPRSKRIEALKDLPEDVSKLFDDWEHGKLKGTRITINR